MSIARAADGSLPTQTLSIATSKFCPAPGLRAAAASAWRKTSSAPAEKDEIIFDQLWREKESPGALGSLLAKRTSLAFPGRRAP